MKWRTLFMTVLACAALLCLAGCPNTGVTDNGSNNNNTDDNGGSGADFDATQYYTKGEIDNYIEGERPNYAGLADMMPTNHGLIVDTQNSYASGAGTEVNSSLTPLIGELCYAEAGGFSGSLPVVICVGDSASHYSSCSVNLTAGDARLVYLSFWAAPGRFTGTVNWWVTGLSTGETVKITPMLYFKDYQVGKP
jgi:hypothetical protein